MLVYRHTIHWYGDGDVQTCICAPQGIPVCFICNLKGKDLHGLGVTSSAVVNLSALLTALVGPGEVGNGNEEERVAGVRDTGEGIVPENLLVDEIRGDDEKCEHTKQ